MPVVKESTGRTDDFTPFAYPELRAALRRSAVAAVVRYLRDHADLLPQTIHSEKQIQVHVAPGITVDGRIDLIRRLDTGETSIVDFKSSERAQDEDVTRDQLHVYVLGYRELTGETADLVEVLNLDPEAKSTREIVEQPLIDEVRDRIRGAGESLARTTCRSTPVGARHATTATWSPSAANGPQRARRRSRRRATASGKRRPAAALADSP